MASSTVPAGVLAPPHSIARQSEAESIGRTAWRALVQILSPLASLKLTVALLCMAIFLVFVGTLAQDEQDMWEVVHNYFRSFLTYVEFEVFFPKAWFPKWQGHIPPEIPAWIGGRFLQFPKGFYFPGGLTVGLFMAVNLAAAHAVRFKVQARGGPLVAGLLTILFGALVAVGVVVSGHNSGGMQDVPAIGWDGVWYSFKSGLVLLWLASLGFAVWMFVQQGTKRPGAWLMAAFAGGMTIFMLFLLVRGDAARLSDPSLRILWQLAKGWLAALIMLAGCGLAFRQRCGIVLLHAGVALIMFNELFVGINTVEERMHINEGQTVNFARDIRSVELAVVDPSDGQSERVIAIPMANLVPQPQQRSILWGRLARLFAAFGPKPAEPGHLSDDRLPFNVEVVEYFKNADVRDLKPGEQPVATAGEGLKMAIEELRAGSGADTDSSVDMAAAVIKLTTKKGEDLGTYLLSQYLGEAERADVVKMGDNAYHLFLRFKRNYKPYTVKLLDVSKRDYVGTVTPRDYSSTVQLDDPARNFKRDNIRIWMNNPLRYAGETFYQSGYNNTRGVESTDLQLVTNTGWMIPYLGCMIVATGLLAQFGLTLVRFINKLFTSPPQAASGASVRLPGHKAAQRPSTPPAPAGSSAGSLALQIVSIGFTLWILFIAGYFLLSISSPAPTARDGFDLAGFGSLPVVYQGRQKPFDTLARNSMRVISDRETYVDENDNRQPAIRWLLDLISEVRTKVKDPDTDKEQTVLRAWTCKIVRIENGEVLDALELEPRPGSYRYSIYELVRDGKLEAPRKAILAAIQKRGPSTAADLEQALKDSEYPLPEHEINRLLAKLERRGLVKLHEGDDVKKYEPVRRRSKMEAFEKQVEEAKRLKPEDATLYHKKLVELDHRIRTFTMLSVAFQAIEFPTLPTDAELRKDPDGGRARMMQAREDLLEAANQIPKFDHRLTQQPVPMPVPVPPALRKPVDKEVGFGGPEPWLPYPTGWHRAFRNRLMLDGIEPQVKRLETFVDKNPDANEKDRRELEQLKSHRDQLRMALDSQQGAEAIHKLLQMYEAQNAAAFNRVLNDYHEWLKTNLTAPERPANEAKFLAATGRSSLEEDPAYLNFNKLQREVFFNSTSPFFYAAWLYTGSLIIALLGIMFLPLGWSLPFRRASFWLNVTVLIVHSLAIYERIYISGRPPVTNLYSSAVFIGWGAVALGLIFEMIYRVGLGNLVASAMGFVTLYVAYLLSGDGDTFTVLQAVLDTQFWLATHVTCVTLGYATTYVAGALGMFYVVFGMCTPSLGMKVARLCPTSESPSRPLDLIGRLLIWIALAGIFFRILSYISYWPALFAGLMFLLCAAADVAIFFILSQSGSASSRAGNSALALSSREETVGRVLGWMVYGTLCFAILFSFVGTVLGGLWADDSWGRFWGWDPKENGALIIVLWNAVVLHARWGGMVKERGMAVLAIAGCIVTTWSWFGVNELGIGLHSYGFTEGVLLKIALWVAFFTAWMAIGLIPKRLWWSFYTPRQDEVVEAKEVPLQAEVL